MLVQRLWEHCVWEKEACFGYICWF